MEKKRLAKVERELIDGRRKTEAAGTENAFSRAHSIATVPEFRGAVPTIPEPCDVIATVMFASPFYTYLAWVKKFSVCGILLIQPNAYGYFSSPGSSINNATSTNKCIAHSPQSLGGSEVDKDDSKM
ncbi:uncharacterized protein G2W53_006389 [Senna tora]|uniref:Uncharacterized protein n=1 Tax=Senna tora TaxID=362788 RepID=A0A834X3X2_9FABA|nr:uncharacterized protein G2W53_006389 [Senna tora]